MDEKISKKLEQEEREEDRQKLELGEALAQAANGTAAAPTSAEPNIFATSDKQEEKHIDVPESPSLYGNMAEVLGQALSDGAQTLTIEDTSASQSKQAKPS